MRHRPRRRRIPTVVGLCLLPGVAGCGVPGDPAAGSSATSAAASSASASSAGQETKRCTEPLGDMTPRKAGYTAYDEAVDLDLSATSTMTLGLRTPKRGIPEGGPRARGGEPGQRGAEVEATVEAQALTSAETAINKTEFSLVDRSGHVCVPPQLTRTGEVGVLDHFAAGQHYRRTLVFAAPKGLHLRGAVIAYDHDETGRAERIWE